MSQEPKRRHSIARKGKRRAAISLHAKQTTTCRNCGAKTTPHAVCANCGFYKGREIVVIKTRAAAAK